MGLREITGAIATGFIGIYMLWFVIPTSKTAYNTEIAAINQTTPLMQQILPITNNWWSIFPLLIIVLVGYTIWLYATDRLGFDY